MSDLPREGRAEEAGDNWQSATYEVVEVAASQEVSRVLPESGDAVGMPPHVPEAGQHDKAGQQSSAAPKVGPTPDSSSSRSEDLQGLDSAETEPESSKVTELSPPEDDVAQRYAIGAMFALACAKVARQSFSAPPRNPHADSTPENARVEPAHVDASREPTCSEASAEGDSVSRPSRMSFFSSMSAERARRRAEALVATSDWAFSSETGVCFRALHGLELPPTSILALVLTAREFCEDSSSALSHEKESRVEQGDSCTLDQSLQLLESIIPAYSEVLLCDLSTDEDRCDGGKASAVDVRERDQKEIATAASSDLTKAESHREDLDGFFEVVGNEEQHATDRSDECDARFTTEASEAASPGQRPGKMEPATEDGDNTFVVVEGDTTRTLRSTGNDIAKRYFWELVVAVLKLKPVALRTGEIVGTLVSYDSRERAALKYVCEWLRLPNKTVPMYESLAIWESIPVPGTEITAATIAEATASSASKWRYTKITTAAIAGGALLAITGGLAAPALGAGLAAVTSGTAAAGVTAGIGTTTAGIAMTTTAFGAAGAGLTGYKMHRRTRGLTHFEFLKVPQTGQGGASCEQDAETLHDLPSTNTAPDRGSGSRRTPDEFSAALNVVVSGWVFKSPEDFISPWTILRDGGELDFHEDVVALAWEKDALIAVSNAMRAFLQNQAVKMVAQEAIKNTVLVGVAAALVLPAAVVAASGAIDNTWSIALNRAKQAGEMLGEILSKRLHGQRPISLFGFSMGARVIYYCLLYLKAQGHYGIIDQAVLMGTPVSSSIEEWRSIRQVVAHRLVNVFSTRDWVLAFLYRAANLSYTVAGLSEIDEAGVLNVDATHIVGGNHAAYKDSLTEIVTLVQGGHDIDVRQDVVPVEIEESRSNPS